MEPGLQWGLDVIRAVQSVASPPLTVLMNIITSLGDTGVFLILLTLVYWCVDEKKGLRLSVIFLISLWVNIHLKHLIGQDRPPFEMWLAHVHSETNGFPSGHAQNTVILYFILASFIVGKFPEYKNRIYAYAAVLCFLIGFSRIYLGVHYPTDVLGGWIFGGIFLCGYFMLSGRIETLLVKGIGSEENARRTGMITSAVFSFILITVDKYTDVPEAFISGGIILGLGIGYCLNRKYVGFKSVLVCGRTGFAKYLFFALRLIAGIAGFILLFIGIGKLIPFNSPNSDLYNFIRFFIVGLWVSLAAPWIFVKLRFAETGLGETITNE
jgi:membrane-associated phospholipid phosphatase